ncbi:MAG: helix-hairpin-helix domain-containing protein [Victivallaceae bacterium]|nr:helix-hairpin-helix domain-containing protein [Victivallaceae bacterium]
MDYINFNISELDEAALAELVEHHNRLYWEKGEPEIPDVRYDELVEALRAKNPSHPLLEAVMAPSVSSGGKVRHREPMLSLDKAYSLEAVLEWARKFARTPDELLLVQPKYDGISAGFDGKILETRGDGEYGEDVTDKLPLIELEYPGYVGPMDRPCRGEIVIRRDDFESIYSRVRRKDGQTYKNSRNAVAGIMGLKDIADMLAQGAKLTLADYRLVSFDVKLSALEFRWEELKGKLAALPYPQDGIVLKLADDEYRRSLGNTAHHPRGEIAYKFTNIRRQTKLLGVEWSFGKNCLTPVAELAPVEISGTTIRRATLHNLQNILDLGIMIGDEVTVERAGDVIPYISACKPGGERRSPVIDNCPCCKTALVRRGPELCCPNRDCPETVLQRLLAAVRNLGIEHLGEPTLRKIMEKFNVRRLRELFSLGKHDIMRLDGFGDKSAGTLVDEISKASVVEDYKLLAALNIPGVGPNIAKILLSERTLDELRSMDEEALSEIAGIGQGRAGAIRAMFREQGEFLDELLGAIKLVHIGSGDANAKTICFTGKMPEKRSYYAGLAVRIGYAAVDSVTSALSLLVAADPNGDSSKLKNARKQGVKVISLDEFMAMAGEGNSAPANDEPVQDELF